MSKLYEPMVVVVGLKLYCPHCGFIHVDSEEWSKQLHHTHLCLKCHREFTVYTVGSWKQEEEPTPSTVFPSPQPPSLGA